MNDRQNAKFQMYKKVLDVCSENESEYAGIPACVSAVNDLKIQVKKILEVSKQRTEIQPTVVSEVKSSAIDRLAELGLKVAYPLYAHAFSTGDKHLLGKVNVNKSMFYNSQDQSALTLAKIIAESAKANREVLRNNYGISDADMAELDAVIAEFEKLMVAPSGEIIKRKGYTGSLRELFV
ncbi:MAG: hypothetical protein LBL13_07900, partial [Bacteroidales bacterium]|nr:hypothetical protein [Bacteroidales bacterium]